MKTVRPEERLETRLIHSFTGCGLRSAVDLADILGRLRDGEIGTGYIEKLEAWRWVEDGCRGRRFVAYR